MATIDELMKDKLPGSMKLVQDNGWDKGMYFIPSFKDDDHTWHGLTEEGSYHYEYDWDIAGNTLWKRYGVRGKTKNRKKNDYLRWLLFSAW